MKFSFLRSFSLFFGTFFLVLFLFYYSNFHHSKKPKVSSSVQFNFPPGSICPCAYDIDYRIYYFGFSIHFLAKKFYFQKGRLFFFRTRLLKQLVLENVTLSVFRNKEKLLEIKKRKLKLNPKLKKIVILHPQVVYVKGDFLPKKVYIFPKKGKIKIVDRNGSLYEL